MKYINSILPKELIERTDAYNIEIRGNNVVIEPHEGVAIEYLP